MSVCFRKVEVFLVIETELPLPIVLHHFPYELNTLLKPHFEQVSTPM
jgi:hypothetical protein